MHYPQWQQYKTYEGHIRRLRTINKHPHSVSMQKSSLSPFTSKPFTKAPPSPAALKTRSKTTTSLGKHHLLTHPIPSISLPQSHIIKNTLNAQSIPLKSKEHLLQNYLISRRILGTKPVIKKQSLERQYNFYRKIGETMSKGKIAVFQKERDYEYKKYQKQKNNKYLQLGNGQKHLTFFIKNVLLIKGSVGKNDNTAYTIKVKYLGKKDQVRALGWEELVRRGVRIRFNRESSLKSVQVYLYYLRENYQQQIGVIKVDCSDFRKDKIKICKITKNNFAVGTAQLQGSFEQPEVRKDTVQSLKIQSAR